MQRTLAIAALCAAPAIASAEPIMLFLHGMQSKYDRPVEQVETAADKYADETGYKLEVIPPTGDDAEAQEKLSRERIDRGLEAVANMMSMPRFK